MSIKKGIESANSTPSRNNTTLNFAMAYSQQLNYTIFPIGYKSKVPITKRGFHDASKDVEQIKEWFTKHPKAGIGLPTGKVNDVIAIDIDPRNGGMVSFERLVDEYAPFPHTVESLTGGNGFHKLFKYDERINKSSIEGYPGLDIQSDGKYIILPPSFHPSGKQYHWEDASKPVITKMAELPSWFIDLVTDRHSDGKHKAKPKTHFLDIVKGVDDGKRTQSLTSLIGHLLARKIDYEIAFQLILGWNLRNNPPIDEREVKKTFENIMKRELEKR